MLTASSLTLPVNTVQYDGSEGRALIATYVQAHTAFSCLCSVGVFEKQSTEVNIVKKGEFRDNYRLGNVCCTYITFCIEGGIHIPLLWGSGLFYQFHLTSNIYIKLYS